MLIECQECGGKISDSANTCPHCGASTYRRRKIARKITESLTRRSCNFVLRAIKYLIPVAVLALIYFVWYGLMGYKLGYHGANKKDCLLLGTIGLLFHNSMLLGFLFFATIKWAWGKVAFKRVGWFIFCVIYLLNYFYVSSFVSGGIRFLKTEDLLLVLFTAVVIFGLLAPVGLFLWLRSVTKNSWVTKIFISISIVLIFLLITASFGWLDDKRILNEDSTHRISFEGTQIKNENIIAQDLKDDVLTDVCDYWLSFLPKSEQKNQNALNVYETKNSWGRRVGKTAVLYLDFVPQREKDRNGVSLFKLTVNFLCQRVNGSSSTDQNGVCRIYQKGAGLLVTYDEDYRIIKVVLPNSIVFDQGIYREPEKERDKQMKELRRMFDVQKKTLRQ